jgi:hypothetical protein
VRRVIEAGEKARVTKFHVIGEPKKSAATPHDRRRLI